MKRKVTANRLDFNYFGEEAFKQYGDMISKKCPGMKISKRVDKGEQPGGLVYEAEQLGIGMWDLLEALEGMCRNGTAEEIDDSTYYVYTEEDMSKR